MSGRKQAPSQRKRLTDEQLAVFGEIFPGFDTWYRENHDVEGRYVGQKLPGLKSPEPEGNDVEESES